MHWRRVFKALGFLAAGLSAAWPGVAALAVEQTLTSHITRTLTATGGLWGGCMAQLEFSLSSEGLDCAGRWVTFSCAGEDAHASKEAASRLFDAALLAFALDRQVQVTVDDAKKQTGYCYASKVELLGD